MAKGPRPPTRPDRVIAKSILDSLWQEVLNDEDLTAPNEIVDLANSGQTAIRFCLPTQLLGKAVDPELDALCLQRGDGLEGRWDPRGFASAVIVPWNRANQNVLGPSADPYVSNPLRRPRVDSGLAQMSERAQWEALGALLTRVQGANNSDVTTATLKQVLVAMRNRLRELTFNYTVPPRVSLAQANNLVSKFLAERSGGDRGLSVVAALFEAIRVPFGYKEVRRGVVNATDTAMQSAGDLECIGADGNVELAVEVKERRVDDADVEIAIAKARALAVQELLLCTEGITTSERTAVEARIGSAWASGTNVYHATIYDLMAGVLPLLGEKGTRDFVVQIGEQLDRFSTQPIHRKAWKTLLDGL